MPDEREKREREHERRNREQREASQSPRRPDDVQRPQRERNALRDSG